MARRRIWSARVSGLAVPGMIEDIMRALSHIIVPSSTPTPFLSVVGACFLWSIPGAVLAMLVIRYGWRRRKGMEDL
jgi:hypothetical protein